MVKTKHKKHSHHHTIDAAEKNHAAHLEDMFEHARNHFSPLEINYFILKEARFYSGNNILAEPDITIFLPYSKQIYLVEYKGNDSTHLRAKAHKQLGLEKMLLETYFNQYNVKEYYVHNNYEGELWK